LKIILIKSLRNFTRIPWSSNSSRNQKSFEWLDNKAGHQNSDRNSWRVSKEFCGHLEKNSDQNTFRIPWSSKFLIGILVGYFLSFSKWISRNILGSTLFVLQNSQNHLMYLPLKFPTNILIKIIEEFHKNSAVSYSCISNRNSEF